MPGSIPPTSQLDWLISTTAMIVLLWSRATRDLLKSFGWGIAALHRLMQRRSCHVPAARPIASIGPLSYDQYPNGLKKAPGQPRCARTREMRGRSRYPDNRMFRRGPMSCPNALPKPCASRDEEFVRWYSPFVGAEIEESNDRRRVPTTCALAARCCGELAYETPRFPRAREDLRHTLAQPVAR